MRPDPPEPNTPNTGRRTKYRRLVEPEAPRKRERATTALIAAAGFGAAVLLDAASRLLS